MEIDLYRDWVAYLRSELDAFGYNTTQMTTPESVVHTFLNLTKRLVRPTPRKVLKAKAFSCPSNLEAGLSEVERKILAGGDISTHLSRLLRNPTFNDPLLNHWDIHHVHLGTTVESDGFVTRTGPVLFARFDDENAYFIDVLPHGSWSLQRLVEELHDNWPESIRQFRLNGVISLARSVSDDDVKTLRKRNVNTMVDLGGGNVYTPIGGGYSTSGLSTNVVIQSDLCLSRLREMQKAVIDNISTIAAKAEEKGLSFPESPQFGLQIEGGKLFAVEVNSMIAVPLGEL